MPARRRKTTARTTDPRISGAVGAAFAALGALGLAACAWPMGTLTGALRDAAGLAAAPACACAVGLGCLAMIGVALPSTARVAAGMALCLAATAAWAQALAGTGGAAGAWLHAALTHAVGTAATHIALALAATVGAALALERPFFAWYNARPKPVERPARAPKAAVRPARPEPKAAAARPAPAADPAAVRPDRAVVRTRGADPTAGPTPAAEPPEERRAPSALRKWASRATDQEPAQTAFPTLDHETRTGEGSFRLPPVSLLAAPAPVSSKSAQQDLSRTIETLEQTLDQFGIPANVVEIARGPTITRYEIQLAPGIKVSKIVSLADNLAMSLAAIDVRLEAPIPGKSAIGVEVPNSTPTVVTLRECIDCPDFWNAPSKLTVVLGKDVSGANRYADLARMPHLLIGGSTNSGKSVCLNVLIASIVYRAAPSEVKLLLIDPKRVELSLWDGIPHLMHPVVRDVKQAAGIFRAALKEMDRRYELFARLGTRNLEGYNGRVPAEEKLPFIVIVVDELADLMMQCAAEVETAICRLAQLARATGIHLVIATQRPSVNVITGTIKANIPSRVAFAVSSQIDSRTILDGGGAERLVGRGDMLFLPIEAHKPARVQGAYLSETETAALVGYLKEQETPEYTMTAVEASPSGTEGSVPGDEAGDELFESAVRLVVSNGQASTSMLQRRFKIGYNRAARLLDAMEARGIVGPLDGAKPREVLINRDEVDRMFAGAA